MFRCGDDGCYDESCVYKYNYICHFQTRPIIKLRKVLLKGR